jgi:hypothetical protein
MIKNGEHPLLFGRPRLSKAAESVRQSIDPFQFLKSLLEDIGDFPGGLLGSALNLAAAAHLPVAFIPVLTMSPAGFAVAMKVAAPNADPGVLLPPDSSVPDPSLRNP